MSRAADPDRNAEASRAAGRAGSGCAEAVVPARPTRPFAALAGFREPVVWILLAIAFFTSISGKPVDGVLMLIVAIGLAWDAGRRARDGGHTGSADAGPAATGPAETSPAATGGAERGRARSGGGRGARGRGRQSAGAGETERGRGHRRLLVLAVAAGGVVYAGVVGSFIRYSWPATAGIIGLGTVVVLIGWHGPLRHRPAHGRLPVAGTLAWCAVLVAGCLWELAALLQQPSITTDSYAHPTISTLTDPVLASSPGRAAILAAWLALGWYLVER